MKIPAQHHQFKERNTFLIVSGKQEAVIYQAVDGSLDEFSRLKIEAPATNDKPGVTKLRSHGKDLQEGMALEDKQSQQEVKALKKFLKDLSQEIKKLEPQATEVYLFVPQYLENVIMEVMTPPLRAEVRSIFYGNHIKDHPLDLVKLVDQFLQDKKVVPTDPEAVKILKKGQAES